MKRLGLVIFSLLSFYWGTAQLLDLKELNNLLDLRPNKLETHIAKRGFKRDCASGSDQASFFQTQFSKNDSQTITRGIKIVRTDNSLELVYQTNSLEEVENLKKDLQSAGFTTATVNSDPSIPAYYQKRNVSFTCFIEKTDTDIQYKISAVKKNIPKPSEILYAEDLLQLDTHEYLMAIFGKANVKLDSFYFTKTTFRKCTVIFPNTNRQAVYLWNDQTNLKDIAIIIIGEQLNREEQNVNPVMLSDWKSKQGIYCGMSLRELQLINKEPVNFYNWRTESAGLLAPTNKGKLNFEQLKPVFSCMNCSFLRVDEKKDIIQSSYAIDENQKVYVASYVVLPERKITNEEGGKIKTFKN